MESEQIAIAASWLDSTDPTERVSGAEQLAAYPTHGSEQLLAEALRADANPEVRSTAARSLQRFRHASDKTLDALLTGLSDADADTRLAALVTLQGFVSHEASDSRRYRMILAKMKSKERDSRIDRETRKAISVFLSDHL